MRSGEGCEMALTFDEMTATALTGPISRVPSWVGTTGIRRNLRRQGLRAARAQVASVEVERVRSAGEKTPHVLVREVMDSYSDLRRQFLLPRSMDQLSGLLRLAWAVAVDNGPSAQLRVDSDSAVEVYWLAGSFRANAAVEVDGGFCLWASWGDAVVLDLEFGPGEEPSPSEAEAIQRFFRDASGLVNHPVA